MGMSHAYGDPSSHKDMSELIALAVDLGCSYFDTAEVYGTPENPHDNEELVGKALKGLRNKVAIGTKCGISFDYSTTDTRKPMIHDARPETILRSCEDSLKRLQTDHIDLYYLHRLDPSTPVEVVAETMARLIDQGKILNWGLSEVTEKTIRKAHAVCPLTAIQNRYSMMARHYEPLFPVLEELGIGLVAYSPMANGLLSGAYGKGSTFNAATDYRSVMPQFTDEAMDKNRDLFALLAQTAERHGATPAQISMAWMICKKPWIVPIPGTRKPERLRENLAAADVLLSAEEVAAIDKALDTMEMSEVFGGVRK